MSEDVKPDPVLDKLGRFTPGPSGIDRDELLFRAGRISARVGLGWKAAVATLAVTQAVTFLALVTAPREPASTILPADNGPPEPEPTGPDYGPLPAHSYGALSRSVEAGELPPVTAVSGPASDRPPLSAASAYHSSGID